MAGLIPDPRLCNRGIKTWMPATSAGMTAQQGSWSLRLDVGGGDDCLIFRDLAANEAGEFVDRERRNLGAVILQSRLHLRFEQDLIDRGVEALGDVGRQRARPEKADPEREVELGNAGRLRDTG